MPRRSRPARISAPRVAWLAWRERLERLHGRPLEGTEPAYPVMDHGSDFSRSLTRDAISRVIKRRTKAAGVEGRFSSHSPRKGFVEDALDLDVRGERIARQGRWRDIKSIDDYYEAAGEPGQNESGPCGPGELFE